MSTPNLSDYFKTFGDCVVLTDTKGGGYAIDTYHVSSINLVPQANQEHIVMNVYLGSGSEPMWNCIYLPTSIDVPGIMAKILEMHQKALIERPRQQRYVPEYVPKLCQIGDYAFDPLRVGHIGKNIGKEFGTTPEKPTYNLIVQVGYEQSFGDCRGSVPSNRHIYFDTEAQLNEAYSKLLQAREDEAEKQKLHYIQMTGMFKTYSFDKLGVDLKN